MIKPVSAKVGLRVLRFLESVGPVKISDFKDGKKTRMILCGIDNEKMVCQPEQLDALHKASLIAMDRNSCSLSSMGKNG